MSCGHDVEDFSGIGNRAGFACEQGEETRSNEVESPGSRIGDAERNFGCGAVNLMMGDAFAVLNWVDSWT